MIPALMLLLTYAAALAGYIAMKLPDTPADIQIKALRATGFINDGLYIEYMNEYVDYLLAFIPVGLLFPFIRGKKCLNLTLIFTILVLTVTECLRIMYFGGIISIDDEIWALAGSLIGYVYFLVICRFPFFREVFDREDGPPFGWLFFAVIFAVTLMYLKGQSDSSQTVTVREKEAAAPAMTVSTPGGAQKSSISTNEAIYDKLYAELSDYSERIVFPDFELKAQDIFNEYVKILNDHPELFWLTGGAKVETLITESGTTAMFIPELEDEPEELPSMVKELEDAVNTYIAECPDGPEYEKALWVHDKIVEETEFDSDVLYYSQTIEDPHFDYAYTAYSALVKHKAVCAGYSRAYQLILNRMGIECGYVTGDALNSHDEMESHAWNYVRLDGQYYFTDVTWDDPVNEDYKDSGRLSHNYFCLSGSDMGKDHFPDEDQFLPECPVSRSPY